jgi:hypothetical protein
MVNDFITYLKNDREFRIQLAGEKYTQPLPPQYSNLEVNDSLRKVLAERASQFYSHQSSD